MEYLLKKIESETNLEWSNEERSYFLAEVALMVLPSRARTNDTTAKED